MISQKHDILKGLRVLVAASGSIAAIKTPLLISRLIKAGAEVKTVITPSASNLISPLSLSTLSRNKCYQDIDQWNVNQTKPLHVELAEWAEIIVIAPLSASSLAKWSNGFADNLLASLLLAYEGPVIAAAGMNTSMWENIAVQRNWEGIKNRSKVLCLEPLTGLLACDRIGEGRMADPELIELAISSIKFQKEINGDLKKDWKNLNLLVTAGPTQEPLDAARIITNRSTGMMGVVIAQAARFRGAKVHLVHGPLSLPNNFLEGIATYPITNANDMQNALKKLQPSANALVMAAAVSDFRTKDGDKAKKLKKENLMHSIEGSLELVPDLLSEFAKNRLFKQAILGFAAVSGNDEEIQLAAKVKKNQKGCDLIMANAIDIPNQGFGENPNGGFLIGPENFVQKLPITSKIDLAHQLLDALIETYRNISSNIE